MKKSELTEEQFLFAFKVRQIPAGHHCRRAKKDRRGFLSPSFIRPCRCQLPVSVNELSAS